jgi:hypothetical protein
MWLRRRENVLGDGLEAGQEEVADGKVGAGAIGQKVVDSGSQFPGAVVHDVVGHLVFLSYLGALGLSHQ